MSLTYPVYVPKPISDLFNQYEGNAEQLISSIKLVAKTAAETHDRRPDVEANLLGVATANDLTAEQAEFLTGRALDVTKRLHTEILKQIAEAETAISILKTTINDQLAA